MARDSASSNLGVQKWGLTGALVTGSKEPPWVTRAVPFSGLSLSLSHIPGHVESRFVLGFSPAWLGRGGELLVLNLLPVT